MEPKIFPDSPVSFYLTLCKKEQGRNLLLWMFSLSALKLKQGWLVALSAAQNLLKLLSSRVPLPPHSLSEGAPPSFPLRGGIDGLENLQALTLRRGFMQETGEQASSHSQFCPCTCRLILKHYRFLMPCSASLLSVILAWLTHFFHLFSCSKMLFQGRDKVFSFSRNLQVCYIH